MDILQAILMGIVQGLSEFLPISSSGHLVITSALYKYFTGVDVTMQSGQEVFLDIMLHVGTLIAVLIFFRKDLTEIIKSVINGIKTKDFSDENIKLAIYIMLGTIITVAVAFPLSDIIEKLVFMPVVTGLLLIITGILLFWSESYSKNQQDKADKPDLKTSLLTGLAQGLAAFPGLSRSGLTIATGMFCKKTRSGAARFSFLLSIPIIFGASVVYPFIKLNISELMQFNMPAIITGTVASAIVGYFCIKYFLKLVANRSLAFFGYYCLITGICTSVFFGFTA